MRGRLALAAGCMVAALGTARAQPRLIPSTDVSATYRLSGPAAQQIPGGSQVVRLTWDAAGQRLRAEPLGAVQGPQVYAITDLPAHVADIVFPAQRSVLELPLLMGSPLHMLAGADARFTRLGAGQELGGACTEWRVQSRRLQATGCVTADGVILQARGTFNGQEGAAVAVAVDRGPVPAEAVTPPPGFFRLPLGTPR